MKYDLKETINAAFMTHKPVAIVEGHDDVKFYSNIVFQSNLNIEIKAIESIDGYGEGCEKVIQAINDTSPLIQNDPRIKKYIVGIIDRDVRQYRNTLPENENIIVLRYYSYETHLITRKTISKLIEYTTNVPEYMINQNVLDYLINDFNSKKLRRLYYFSLEALKVSCDPSYVGVVTYNTEPGRLTGSGGDYFEAQIASKITLLDQFASIRHISTADIKYIAKGKWYLHFWCDYLEYTSKELHHLCGDKFPKCTFCSSGITNKCSWKVNNLIKSINMEELLPTTSFIDFEEISYIIDALRNTLSC